MTTALNPLSELSRATVDAAAKASRISMDSAERVINVQMEYAKGAIAQAAHTARAVSQVKDVQALFALRARIAENTLENLMGYSRSLYEVASGAQSEYSKLAEQRMASLQQVMSETVDEAARSAPAGGDAAVAAMRSQLTAATAAFETFSKAAKSMASLAGAGLTAPRPAKSRK